MRSNGVKATRCLSRRVKLSCKNPKKGLILRKQWNKFYTHFVNTQQAIVNTGKAAGSNLGKIASNTRNASGIVDHNFLEAMVDKNGKKVGASLKEVAESIPKGKEEEFLEIHEPAAHRQSQGKERETRYKQTTPPKCQLRQRRLPRARTQNLKRLAMR